MINSQNVRPLKCYSTAQLQGNICTHPRCVLHAFQTCLACVPDTSCTWSGCIPIWQKGCGNHVRLVTALSQGFALARMHLVHVPYTSHAHPRHVQHTFQMRLARISDAFKMLPWSWAVLYIKPTKMCFFWHILYNISWPINELFCYGPGSPAGMFCLHSMNHKVDSEEQTQIWLL